jgi:hypothetical protein
MMLEENLWLNDTSLSDGIAKLACTLTCRPHWPNSPCHTYLKIFEKKGGQLEFEDAEKTFQTMKKFSV